MNRPRSTLPAFCCWAVGFAMLSMACVPGAASGGEAAEGSDVMEPVRRVHVRGLGCKPGTAADAKSGLSIFIELEAVGLRWRSVLVEIGLRTREGKPVRVVDAAPQGYADEKGRFRMSARVPVFDDRFHWPELRASIPYEKVLDLPAERPCRLIAAVRASCEGLSSSAEAEIAVPPEPAGGVKRALSLLAVDPYPNSPPLDEPADEREDPQDREQPAAPDRPGAGRGLMVEGYVAAEGLRRAKLVGRIAVRGEDGKPPVHEGPEMGTGDAKPVDDASGAQVVSGQAQILLHFLDYRVLGLPPGRHRVILSYTATCDGLSASLEEGYVLPVAPGRSDRPPLTAARGSALRPCPRFPRIPGAGRSGRRCPRRRALATSRGRR